MFWRHCEPAERAEMGHTFQRVIADAARHGFLSVARAAASEYTALVVAPLKRDPLPEAWASTSRSFQRGGDMIPSLHDWRTAVRRAAAHPGHSAVVIAVLALGIAVNTVVFSVADSAMFRGLPYPNGARIHELFSTDHAGRTSNPGLTAASLAEWSAHPEIFEAMEAFSHANFVALGNGEPDQIAGAFVTPGLFGALGVSPVRGRLFDARDAESGRGGVALISAALWQQRFGGADEVVGRTLTLNDLPFTIVGVMPPHFRFPAGQQQVWIAQDARQMVRPQGMVLLKPGLSQDVVQQRVNTISAALEKERPQKEPWGVRLMPHRGTRLDPSTARALEVLTVAVLVVLLIACANLANLGVAQALARQRELAVRAALGASRWRLVRELLAEHLVLGAAGGIAGLMLAWWGVQLAIALAPDALTIWTANEIRIDGRILVFTAVATLTSALLFGILPAWRASRADAGDALKSRTASGTPHGRLRAILVVAEVTLSVVLLIGAALLVRSFTKLTQLDPGFDPRGLTTLSLQVATDRYPAAARRAYVERIAQALRGIPGVTAVAASNGIPTSGGDIHFGRLEVEGRETGGQMVLPNSHVDAAYFSTMKIRILAGRGFVDGDPPEAAVVSETLAQQIAGGPNAVGRRFRLGARGDWWTVVGVAGEVHQSRMLERDGSFEIYTPLWSNLLPAAPTPTRRAVTGNRSFAWLRLTVRSVESAPMTTAAVKSAVWSVDPSQPVGEVLPVDEVLALSLSQERFAAVLMGAFAALALVLAAAGLYAVLSQLVAQRRQEIGIRMALGAGASDVARLVLGRGVGLTAVGVVLGLTAAWAAARLLANQLFGVTPHDPVSFIAVPLTLLTIALLASWLPARSALSVDPASALRAE
jgi:putative ABC transport system permease protein